MKIFSGQVFSNFFSSKPKETSSDREYQRDILESHGWRDPSERYERPVQQADLGILNQYAPFAQAASLTQDLSAPSEPAKPAQDAAPTSPTRTVPEMYFSSNGLRSDMVTETRHGDNVLYSNGTVGFQVDNLVFNSDGTITFQG